VSATETLKAIATDTGDTTSAVGSAAYTILATTPTFSPTVGTYPSSLSVTISDSSTGATIYYTTNGTTPTTSSTKYSSPITVSATETLKAIAAVTGDSNSAVGSALYTILPPVATPTLSPAAGSYDSTQKVTISDTTSGATIYYSINGASPVTYSGPVTVSVSETLGVVAIATGHDNSATVTAAYIITTCSQ
jgi:hypothetical protein